MGGGASLEDTDEAANGGFCGDGVGVGDGCGSGRCFGGVFAVCRSGSDEEFGDWCVIPLISVAATKSEGFFEESNSDAVVLNVVEEMSFHERDFLVGEEHVIVEEAIEETGAQGEFDGRLRLNGNKDVGGVDDCV